METINKYQTEHQTVEVELDCWAVVRHFGGLAKTSRLMQQHGNDLSVDAIDKWRRRKNIPTSQLVTLAAIARERGIRFDIYDFIKERGGDSRARAAK